MKTNNKLKIFNDPIYGFITIPNSLIFDLIEHKYFQRLRRISQMGLSYLVYPGAHHTRFHHAIGCMHLMQKAVNVLRFKEVSISEEEERALYVAILLHDIGHGPFSHAMEHSIVSGISHEDISLRFMTKLNEEFNGSLTLAIQIFEGKYHRPFLCELISSQFDMDRADYLKRDSFYTGVAEGNINSERLITMLNVVDDKLVVEEKGIYSVEKFLVARRFMYWQVYLHKTGLVAEQLLTRVLKRAKELANDGVILNASESLSYFLNNEISDKNFDDHTLEIFARLDDTDIMAAMKEWQYHDDFILSNLCDMIINRDLLKIKLKNKPIKPATLDKHYKALMEKYDISENEAEYFVFIDKISNQAYQSKKQNIKILQKSGKVVDLAKASDQFSIKALSKPVTKYYICYPK
ncbi:HD domain-containing protein [Psychroserpens sp.]|uniref:HD domain-containing protein n=1 Tax=Psychroserpens sp. TaxID=2020870 RepID=UPI001B2C072B|nr:HD domain-containing protein [Psychroserpens sp.]MBO6606466.1 HD domain-containing protein [Psychroserpens sp.]MBO6632670.1 HD domain-containing protein [Psychroserpens sp.]MBO6653170.1 HD domain-containing protein [Psychroserpens sp.]MBO6680802.1 HD domain-containing protein [Psychroserpens sp.]MBO6750240.1 HD domain-containing protein [Psychroserpens sp.]